MDPLAKLAAANGYLFMRDIRIVDPPDTGDRAPKAHRFQARMWLLAAMIGIQISPTTETRSFVAAKGDRR
jgi:hypothetical protein